MYFCIEASKRARLLAVDRVAHHLETQQLVLEVAHRPLATAVITVETVEHIRELLAAGTNFWEEQLAFLGVVQALGKLVDIEHRA